MEKDNQAAKYAAMLADMEAEKTMLDAAIVGLRAWLAVRGLSGGISAPTGGQGPIGEPIALPRGALLGKTGTEAIKIYLGSVKKKQTNKEIGDALKQYGVESTSKNFDTFVNSALFRLKDSGHVLRFDDGWGLTEWYPESFRTRAERVNGGKSKAKKKTSTKGEKKKKAVAKTVGVAVQEKAKALSLDQQILDLYAGTAVAMTPEMVIEVIPADIKKVNFAFARLTARGKVKRTADGYELTVVNMQGSPNTKAS